LHTNYNHEDTFKDSIDILAQEEKQDINNAFNIVDNEFDGLNLLDWMNKKNPPKITSRMIVHRDIDSRQRVENLLLKNSKIQSIIDDKSEEHVKSRLQEWN